MKEGTDLSDAQKSHLLPHFLMLAVGKPGSGKTTLVKHLTMDKEFYKNKFDKVLLVSPSASKTGLPVNKGDVSDSFELEWVYRKLEACNKIQMIRVQSYLKSKAP